MSGKGSGGMGIWQETRNVEKGREAAQRAFMKKRREEENANRGAPKDDAAQGIRLVGLKAKMIRDRKVYNDLESETSLVPCPADPSTMIDRFDGRAMLDIIPPETEENQEQRTELSRSDQALESLLSFERYRDIVRAYRTGVEEEARIRAAAADFDIYLSRVRNEELELAKKKSGGELLPPKPKQQDADASKFHFDFATGANAIAVPVKPRAQCPTKPQSAKMLDAQLPANHHRADTPILQPSQKQSTSRLFIPSTRLLICDSTLQALDPNPCIQNLIFQNAAGGCGGSLGRVWACR
jgi:hypothetical protein